MNNYILDENHNFILEPNIHKWAEWFENIHNRIVKKTFINEIEVSTVFLGTDHNYSPVGLPILFETMIFGLNNDYQERCSTWAEAEYQHNEAIEWLKAAFGGGENKCPH